MNWDTGSAVTETRRADPAVLVVLATAGCHLTAFLLPSISVREGWGVWPPATIASMWLGVWAVYAVGLLKLCVPGRHRLAALSLVGVSAVAVLAERVAFHQLSRFSDPLEDVSRVAPYLIAVPLVAAWGLVRRTGTRWAWGLVATAVVLYALQEIGPELYFALDLAAASATPAPPSGFTSVLRGPLMWIVGWVTPILAGCVGGWLLERHAEPEATVP